MVFEDTGTYYDVLDVRPEATPEELREAYLRAKTAYSKDSVALYTLVDGDDLKRILARIEEAYMVLSNPQRRKEYDTKFGFIDPNEELVSHKPHAPAKKIISIDRVPPMESSKSSDEMLIPPSTDFAGGKPSSPVDNVFPGSADEPDPLVSAPATDRAIRPSPPPFRPEPRPYNPQPPAPATGLGEGAPKFHAAAHAHLATPDPRQVPIDSALEREIATQTEWRGPFLKKVRESMRLSIEEMAAVTKISKTYLMAIEEENFVKLPAPVYVRGFVMQIARILKLPVDQVVTTYLDRYKQLKIR